MARSKQSTKALTQQKYRRRQWLAFVRMCRYGVNNLTRNAWLTIAATAVMIITLLIVFTTFVAGRVLHDTTDEIGKGVNMSIYLKTETTPEEAQPILDALKKLSNVRKVEFRTSEQNREQNAMDNKNNVEYLEAINEANNKIPATIRIELADFNDTSQLEEFVRADETLKSQIDSRREPSFAGQRREIIQNIGKWTEFAQQVGLGASVVFAAISSLIIFNTIRMAIFSRKDEIEMMKLIGADKSFIRGPFVVEAIVYGVVAAIVATGAGIGVLYAISDGLISYEIALKPTIDFLTTYIWLVLLAMLGLGALIGTVSALLATRRYLKI